MLPRQTPVRIKLLARSVIIVASAVLAACTTPRVESDILAEWYPNAEYYEGLSFEQLEAEATTGSIEAQLTLATRLINEDQPPNDVDRAIEIYARLSENGDPRAQYFLGTAHIQGVGVELDESLGVSLLHESAKAGYAMGQFWYAFMISNGRGVPQANWQEAIIWFERAARSGHKKAQFSMGDVYASCRGGTPQDFEKAAMWYRKGVEQMEILSQYNLLHLIATGVIEWEEGDPGSPPDELIEAEPWGDCTSS